MSTRTDASVAVVTQSAVAGLASAVLSGALFALAVPPEPSTLLGLVCLAPLLWNAGRYRYLFNAVRGVVFAFTYYCGANGWLFNVDGFHVGHWMGLFVLVAPDAAVFMIGVRAFALHSALLQSILTAMLWVTIDYLRNQAGFLATPWAGLGQASLDTAAIRQFAALGGEYGVAFAFVLTSALIARAISDRGNRVRLAALAGLVPGLLLVFGVVQLRMEPAEERVFRVVLAHAAWNHDDALSTTNSASLSTLSALSRRAVDNGAAPDLVVWPEGSFKLINAYPFIFGRIHDLSRSMDAAVAFGVSSGSKYVRRGQMHAEGEMANELVYIDWRDRELQSFSKQILVPFGEYVPMETWFPWPDALVPEIVPFRVQAEPALPVGRRDTILVPVICWENLFETRIRNRIPAGPVLGVNISDLSIFRSLKSVEQHNAASIMRAIENGVPFVIATDTGPSLIISATGEILSRTAYGQAGVASVAVPIRSQRTFYWRFGDLPVAVAAVGLTLWTIWVLFAKSRETESRERRRVRSAEDG